MRIRVLQDRLQSLEPQRIERLPRLPLRAKQGGVLGQALAAVLEVPEGIREGSNETLEHDRKAGWLQTSTMLMISQKILRRLGVSNCELPRYSSGYLALDFASSLMSAALDPYVS